MTNPSWTLTYHARPWSLNVASLDDIKDVHGHDGKTEVVWL